MSFPKIESIYTPILQELAAVGGSEDVRFLYDRLTGYFPQLTESDLANIQKWRKLIQKAGRELSETGRLQRVKGIWQITEKGGREIEREKIEFLPQTQENIELNHLEVQHMLVKIGQILNYSGEIEFEFYDVVWREKTNRARLSHVFEVQSKGNLDSALAKLKRAFEAQRSKPILVVANERDTRRALQSLNREFADLQEVVTIMSFAQVDRIFQNLNIISDFMPILLAK